ncbi:hydroxyacid dehydrogenase [Paenibacillus ginsengarvi]|uniref:hydroxyacid dehydrogenase n=1 Tax=Paenibacillus ginsengarvi TaxID=400777 RepID=UPI0013156F3D|nr:hydroxyacid dehydrogenase [Paenibacillus ginsengarvi]
MERKIALLMDRDNLESLFDSLHRQRLNRLGNVVTVTEPGALTPQKSAELIRGAEIVVTSWGCPPLDAAILEQAPDLGLIVHAAGTVKRIVTPDVIARDIPVSSANSELGRRVAETALGLTIVSLKHIWQLARDSREGEFGRNRHRVKEMYGITVGVIGAGQSGKHYLELLRHFRVRALVYDPGQTEEQIRELGAVKTSLEDLMRESDVVSVHAPAIQATNNMINAPLLKMMKDDAILINTARGSLIDEEALVAELSAGRLWACLDVTNPEPTALDHPFRSLPNVTLIPHVAGVVTNGLRSLGEFTVNELEAFAEGRRLQGTVQLEKLHMLA